MARRDACHGCYKRERKLNGRLPPYNPRGRPWDIFNALVDRSGGDAACWPWTGSMNRKGYGYAPRGVEEKTAHRAAWRQVNGAAGVLYVCHRCDNPRCCNPAHLFTGTTQENTADRHAKGRDPRGPEQGEKIRAGHARRRAHAAPPNIDT